MTYPPESVESLLQSPVDPEVQRTMQILLPLVFAVAFVLPDHVEMPIPPAQQFFINTNTIWDHYDLPEDWGKALAVPIGDPTEYAQTASESGLATRMGDGASDVEQWRPLVAGQFPPEQVDNALCVIKSESGGEPHIRNLQGSNARGLFQVMSTVWGPVFDFSHEDFYSPELNTYAAARIWERSGWQPWSPRTRRNCGL